MIFSFICVLALLSGCARKAREITDRTLLPAGASLCGVNLARVRMGSATAAIEQKLGEPQITLLLPGNSVHFRGSELGLRYDVRSALTALCQGEPCDGVALAADRTLFEARLSRFAEGYRTPPTNASVEINRLASEPFSYTDAVAGTAVDLPLLIQKILCATAAGDAGSIVVEVPLRTLEPEVTLADIQKYRQPIASYSTSFAKSPLNAKNRVHNLKKAAAAIHGTVLAPGEEFNCNAVLGDRNKENGWLEAAAIRNGSYVDEYGGGVARSIAYTARFGRNQGLMIDKGEHRRLDQLRLHDGRAHSEQRLIRKGDRSLRHGVDVAREAQLRKRFEKRLVKQV